MALVDSYDAISSNRPYKKGFSKEDSIKELKKNKGKQFDPNLTDLFLELIEK